MADINVERKGPSIWPWIIGLIVLALVIWALAEMFGRDDRRAVGPAEPLGVDTPTQPIGVPPAPAFPADTPTVTQPFPADTPGMVRDTPGVGVP